MTPSLRAMLAVAALTLALAPNGVGDGPRHLGAALAEQRTLSLEQPDDAGVWNDLGNLLVLHGDFDEAESAYARAIELEPASTPARFNLALLRQQRGDLEGAIADYLALLEVDSANAWAHYQLGAAYETQGQRQSAVDRYALAFTLDPELLFAETNPHIIENRLVTEALLHARRGSRSGPPAPRAYDQPDRFTSILQPSAPGAVRDGSTTEQPAEESDTPGAEGEPAPSHHPAPPATEPGEGQGESSDSASLVAPGDRKLDRNDLRDSAVRNQVQGDATAGAAAPGSRRRPSATPGRRPALYQPPATDSTNSFGLRSTGALEWRLGPASADPVPTG